MVGACSRTHVFVIISAHLKDYMSHLFLRSNKALGWTIDMPPKDMNLIILGCMQCMYAASDLAGTMKLQYDIASRIIRMPCTARLDINFILKALQEGADGVLVIGCHPGDCAYKTGNLGAERRVRFARKLVGQLGLNEDRVKMVFVSAAEGDKFAAEINQFADEIREIGPNPIRL